MRRLCCLLAPSRVRLVQRERSAGFVDGGCKDFFDTGSGIAKGWRIGQHRKHGGGFDHADLGFSVLLENGDATGQGHVERHVFGEDFGGFVGIADLQDEAGMLERDAFFVEGGFEIMDVQNAEVAAFDRGFQIDRGLFNAFFGFNDVVHLLVSLWRLGVLALKSR